MSKEATIIQSFNDIKRQYEYSVKGYDVTESVKILLKKHKEAYDKEKNVFAGIDGYLEAQKEYQSQIADLQSQLAEKEGKIETLKQRIESIVKIYSDDFVSKDTELKELIYKVKQHNQDKISFAVEALKIAQKYVKQYVNNFDDMNDCLCAIDDQIKQLKEMK